MRLQSNFILAVGILSTIFFLTNCKKEVTTNSVDQTPSQTLEVGVFPMFGSDSLFLDSTYTTDEGYQVQFTDIKFFGGNWKNGNSVLFDAALFDFRATKNFFARVANSPTSYTAIQGFLGVDSTKNHADPSAFPVTSVLNIANANDMHWDWNPGYIFVKIEAKVDTIPDGIPLFDHFAVFHVGTDSFIQTLDFPVVQWVKMNESTYKASLLLDMHQFLSNGSQPIDLKNEYTSHTAAGQELTTQKVMQNFKSSLHFN
jgi:hypothetical protein